jgi:DNA-binding NarL/FixJ family response regulator
VVLNISEHTVRNHRARLMEKLGVHDRLELLEYAIRCGIISVAIYVSQHSNCPVADCR